MVTYYNGFYYDINQPSRNKTVYAVEIYDSSQSRIIHREIRPNWSYSDAEKYARDWIDVHSGYTPGDIGDPDYDDLPPSGSDTKPPQGDPVQPIGVVYPHTMYDCKTGKAYQARSAQEHMAMDAMGYVHDLSECKTNGGGGGGNGGGGNGGGGNGGGGDNSILETAGVFVVGVAKGTLIAAVPITAMAVAVGFMRRIVRFGVGVSS
jgi:hypothetical protein